jgi:hypothetical protein
MQEILAGTIWKYAANPHIEISSNEEEISFVS